MEGRREVGEQTVGGVFLPPHRALRTHGLCSAGLCAQIKARKGEGRTPGLRLALWKQLTKEVTAWVPIKSPVGGWGRGHSDGAREVTALN